MTFWPSAMVSPNPALWPSSPPRTVCSQPWCRTSETPIPSQCCTTARHSSRTGVQTVSSSTYIPTFPRLRFCSGIRLIFTTGRSSQSCLKMKAVSLFNHKFFFHLDITVFNNSHQIFRGCVRLFSLLSLIFFSNFVQLKSS